MVLVDHSAVLLVGYMLLKYSKHLDIIVAGVHWGACE